MPSLPKAYRHVTNDHQCVVAGGVIYEVVEVAVTAEVLDAVIQNMDYSGEWTSERPKNYMALVKLIKFAKSWGLKDAKDLVDLAVGLRQARLRSEVDPEVALQRRDDARDTPIADSRPARGGRCGRLTPA